MILPQVIILSTQRSGTHLLESFLASHPGINGRGEMFLRLQRSGIIENNVNGKINIGILMYDQIHIFKELGGNFFNHKIIHLLREPFAVALSLLQMQADKKETGANYKAHYQKTKLSDKKPNSFISQRGVLDITYLETLKDSILKEQEKHIEQLKSIYHLQLRYEDLAPGNETVEYLNAITQGQLTSFLELPSEPRIFHTAYLKTGINLPTGTNS